MIPLVEICTPHNLDELLNYLSDERLNSKIIAGGTDIIPGFHIESSRFKDFDRLIDLHNVTELNKIEETENHIVIGAASTFTALVESEIIKIKLPVLNKAARGIGSKQIRNKATIAGNFVNNAPCADSVPALLVYNAKLKIKSKHDQRLINISDFLKGPYKTTLGKKELVTEIIIPKSSANMKGDFYKLGRRRAVAVSRITLGLLYEISDDKFHKIRIASGAVTPIGQRFYDIESFATGKKVNEELLKHIAIKAGEKVLEATGLRWSTPYKLPVLQKTLYNLLYKNCLLR